MELFTQVILSVWAVLIFIGLIFFGIEGDGKREVKDWIVTAWTRVLMINVVLTFVWVEMKIFGA